MTGATGSLGSHIVAQLVANDSVKMVYCLVRRSASFGSPLQRVIASLQSRKLLHSATGNIPTAIEARQLAKVVAYNSNLAREDLGLRGEDYNGLLRNLTEVIHCAWVMNYDMQLTSFEHLIRGSSNLISLCLKSTRIIPASFNFTSSIAAAPPDTSDPAYPAVAAVAGVPFVAAAEGVKAVPAVQAVLAAPAGMVHESRNNKPTLLNGASGYAQSKYVVERLCDNAVESAVFMTARVHRLGYLAGDRDLGRWSKNEEYPLIVRSLETIKFLPSRPLEHLSLLPVDDAAKACVELMFSTDDELDGFAVFNVSHPKLISWNDIFLPGVTAAGLAFEQRTSSQWLAALKAANPTYPLINYFESVYAADDDISCRIATVAAQRCSAHLRNCTAIDVNLVKLFVQGWKIKAVV